MKKIDVLNKSWYHLSGEVVTKKLESNLEDGISIKEAKK